MTSSRVPALSGRLAQPSDDDWDAARAAWNLAIDQRPPAVALVESAEDIAAVIRYATANGLRVTAQGTGHGAAPLGALDDTVLIKTERMRGLEVDRAAGTARLQAGVLADELGAAAQAAELSALPGSSPDVGVVGFTLGGGLGWLGRRYGFACNRVRAIELVAADGESRRVDAEHDAELFWALRGGGGNYAIVTALEIELAPISEVYAGMLIFPAELGGEAIHGYREWAVSVNDDVTSAVRFLRLPPLPVIPEPLRDRPLLTLGAACVGSREQGEQTIAPLRELGEPISDSFAQIPAAALARINMDPEQPVPGIGHHDLVHELPDEAIDAFVAVAGPEAGSSLLLAELRHLGGALARPAEHGGALSKIDAGFLLNGIGTPTTPEAGEAINADLDRLQNAMHAWASDGGYLNFAERPCDVDAILPPDVCERLGEVKRRWDPDGTIRSNHEVVVGA